MESKAKAVHLFGELFSCQQSSKLMLHAETLREECIRLVNESGLTIVGDCFYQFPGEGSGVTGTVILAESHLALHTWPESGYVSLDVFVCNYTTDNRPKALKLFDSLAQLFKPGRVNMAELHREQP
jgi:S-adenosylmethionine decarboxylase